MLLFMFFCNGNQTLLMRPMVSENKIIKYPFFADQCKVQNRTNASILREIPNIFYELQLASSDTE